MSPSEEYSRRLALWEANIARLDGLHRRLGATRLALAASAAIMAWIALGEHVIAAAWLFVPVATFVAVVVYHVAVRRRRSRADRAAAFYRRGLERLEDRWAGAGVVGERFNDPHHVYAADLDLFAPAGLFELMCAARTRMGEETLASWLLAPADGTELRERHEAFEDLTERLELREDVAMLPGAQAAAVEPHALLAWAESSNVLEASWIRWAAYALPLLCGASAVVWAVLGTPVPFIAIVLAELVALYRLRTSLGEVLDATERAFDDLNTFAGLLSRVEREPFRASALKALVRGLASDGTSAARIIERLSTLCELAGSRENMIVKLLSVPLLYSVHVALAAERWRAAHGPRVRAWASLAGRFEALSSLAQYGFEHPEDPLPQFVRSPQPRFEAAALGHPLLPAKQCVRNDVALALPTRALLVSGSNMSGKSTLLRAVGLNTVLAMAGAPVRARSLRLTPLQVGASIRINDSLGEGRSRFYAEIVRLRQLFDLSTGEPPLVFLLDELLQGTNSKDRRIGVDALLRAFARHNAIGLVTTHDLALTELEGLEPLALRNVHFQDEVRDGRMVFDFKLRDGVVEKSNGLELMRSIGLDV